MGFLNLFGKKKQLNIMVVDDSAVMRKMIIKVLKQTDLHIDSIIEAGDGMEATSKFDPEVVSIVMTDWNMPKMTGLQFVQNIKKACAKHRIPIMMITTETGMDSIQEAMQNGVDDYLMKPFTPDKLKGKLAKWLEMRADGQDFKTAETPTVAPAAVTTEVAPPAPIIPKAPDDLAVGTGFPEAVAPPVAEPTQQYTQPAIDIPDFTQAPIQQAPSPPVPPPPMPRAPMSPQYGQPPLPVQPQMGQPPRPPMPGQPQMGQPPRPPMPGQPQMGQPPRPPMPGQPQMGQPPRPPMPGQPQMGQPPRPPMPGQPQMGQPPRPPMPGQPQMGQPPRPPMPGQPQMGQPPRPPMSGQPQMGQPPRPPMSGQPPMGQPPRPPMQGQPMRSAIPSQPVMGQRPMGQQPPQQPRPQQGMPPSSPNSVRPTPPPVQQNVAPAPPPAPVAPPSPPTPLVDDKQIVKDFFGGDNDFGL